MGENCIGRPLAMVDPPNLNCSPCAPALVNSMIATLGEETPEREPLVSQMVPM